MVVSNSIYPTTYKNHLYIDEAFIAYNLVRNENICLMRYFVKMISRTATKLDSKEAIEIGVLVTKLYMYHGVVAREGVQIIKQLGVVNNSILK